MERNTDGDELQDPLFVQVKEEPNSESDGDTEENSFKSNDMANEKPGCIVKMEKSDVGQDLKSEESLGGILKSESYGKIVDNLTETGSHMSTSYQYNLVGEKDCVVKEEDLDLEEQWLQELKSEFGTTQCHEDAFINIVNNGQEDAKMQTEADPDAAKEGQPKSSEKENTFAMRKEQETCGIMMIGNKGTETISLRHNLKVLLKNPLLCNTCGMSFEQESCLVEHERTHMGEGPFKCSYCDVTFARAHNKEDHERRHRGEHLFVCKTCSKTFAYASYLQSHTLVHTENRPFECATCGATFKRSKALDCHMRTHTHIKPYKCSVCHKEFKWKESRDDHERCHSGNRPFQCSE